MALVLNYFIESLGDFILLAIDSPLRATIILLLLSSLAFSNFWADWIANLQQPPPLNVTGINNAIQRPNDGGDARPDRSRAESSSSVSTHSSQSPRLYRWPLRSPLSPSNSPNASNTNGNIAVRPPPRNRSNVSFYPSTSPRNRGTVGFSDAFGSRPTVDEVLPTRQHEIHSTPQHDPIPWEPSSLDQYDIDAQLREGPVLTNWDRIRPRERQAMVDARRMVEECRVDIQRVEAGLRALRRRRERQMREEQERRRLDVGMMEWETESAKYTLLGIRSERVAQF